VALTERARESDVVAEFAVRMRTTLRTLLLDGVRRAVPTGRHELIADAILAVADGTHGWPERERRRLLAFAIARLTAP
jgi:hypothetical protein